MSKCKYCYDEDGDGPSSALMGKYFDLGLLGKKYFSVYVLDGTIDMGFDMCKGIHIKIKYCPMCGRKLGG